MQNNSNKILTEYLNNAALQLHIYIKREYTDRIINYITSPENKNNISDLIAPLLNDIESVIVDKDMISTNGLKNKYPNIISTVQLNNQGSTFIGCRAEVLVDGSSEVFKVFDNDAIVTSEVDRLSQFVDIASAELAEKLRATIKSQLSNMSMS